jgi:hypothetical protein
MPVLVKIADAANCVNDSGNLLIVGNCDWIIFDTAFWPMQQSSFLHILQHFLKFAKKVIGS